MGGDEVTDSKPVRIRLTESESLILGLAKERELELIARAQELANKSLAQAIESMVARGALPTQSHAAISLTGLDKLPYPTHASLVVQALEESRPEAPEPPLEESEASYREPWEPPGPASPPPAIPPAGSLGPS